MIQCYVCELLLFFELEMFSGEFFYYFIWKKFFDIIVERRIDSLLQCFYYFGRYIIGEVKELISGFFVFDSEDVYFEVRKILFDRFGNLYFVVNVYKKKIKEWFNVLFNDGISFCKFLDFLVYCQVVMKEIYYL